MKDISKQILNFSEKKRIFIYFVPRKNLIAEITLQKTGVYDLIEQPIGEFTLDLIPYDNDLLSMEVPFGFKELETVKRKKKKLKFVLIGRMVIIQLYIMLLVLL